MRVFKTDSLYKDIINGLKEFQEITSITDFSNVKMYLSEDSSLLVILVDATETYPTSLDDDIEDFMQNILSQYNIQSYILQVAPNTNIRDTAQAADIKKIFGDDHYIVWKNGTLFLSGKLNPDKIQAYIQAEDAIQLKYIPMPIENEALMEEIYEDYK